MAWLWTGAVGDDRDFFIVPSLAGAVLLVLLAVVPGSPGWLSPPVGVAAGLGVATVAALFAVPSARLGLVALISSVATTTAVAVAIAGTRSTELALALLFWLPCAGCQAGLAWSRLTAVMAQAAVVAAVVFGVFSLHGRLAALPFVAVACAVGVLAAAPATHLAFHRGRRRFHTDALTDLATRAGLVQTGEPLVADILATGRRAALMVVDLDHFKEINTAFGYEAGDEVLRRFARWLSLVKPTPLVVARLGGDKFALLLPVVATAGDRAASLSPESTNPELADLGRAVLRQIDGRLRIAGVDVEVEATAGLTAAPSCGQRVTDLLSCADAALADARRCGERVGVWTTGMTAVQPWELALHAQLRSAITKGELELFYQPIWQAATRRIVGVEGLMRWRHPTRGLLPPGSFLPMAERSSLIVELTWWTIDEALGQCARWRAAGIQVAVSVNLSPRLLVIDELPQVVTERLAAHGLPSDVLTLEITENALVSQPARAAAMLDELRVSGVRLSMDDFGTGWNSMEILKALTFDEIKIDRSFVADAQGSLPDLAIVRSVVDLGHRLGLRVVGEGVEDERSERILTELGCDVLQGDALAPAMPVGAVTPLLAGRPRQDAGARTTAAAAPTGRPTYAPWPDTPGQPSGNGRSTGNGHSAGSGHSAHGGPAENGGPAANGRRGEGDLPGEEQVRDTVTGRTREHWTAGGLAAPAPVNEDARLAALRGHRLLDTAPEPDFDEAAALAAQVADCTYAHVVFVDAEREWFKSWHGLKITDLGARVGVASHVVWSGNYLEVADASRDLRFAHVVRADPKAPVRFFAGVPLRTSEGHVLGALCVSDRRPRRLAPDQRRALSRLAAQTMRLCDARRERLMAEEVAAGLDRLDQLWHPEDLPAAATLTADVIRSLTGSDAVAVMLATLPGATVFEAAGSSVTPGTEPLRQVGARANPADEAALQALSQVRTPTFIPDPTGTPLIPTERVQRLRIGSALVLPMPEEGGLLGFVAVRWTYPLKRVEPSVLRAATLFTASARYALHRLRSTSCHPDDRAGGPEGHGAESRGPGE